MEFIYLEDTGKIYEVIKQYNSRVYAVKDSEDAEFSTMINLSNHLGTRYTILKPATSDERLDILENEVTSLREEVEDMKKWIDRLEQDVDFNRGGFIS